ncbi:concanavalin A-like lectin/glucanase domain-containing protein [Lactifluus volemus]|nr:concanavalin A-like lectin/glucanase domain-containing protein [Lactifluus volemus]
MRTGYTFLTALSLSLIRCASANFYLKDSWVGADFFSWDWETEDDPTHGRVNYVSQDQAVAKRLAYVEDTKFFMRADNWSIVDSSARGRDSVRISSTTSYDDALFVLDIAHMPAGCATWPAFWTLSKDGPWPQGGEIDIIEGVNLNQENQATLHTTPNCMMPPDPFREPQTGATLSTDCNTQVNFNAGCGVKFDESPCSYGESFNQINGGFYVMSKTQFSGVQIWFWPRNSPFIPPEICKGAEFGRGPIFPNLSWGAPAANFPMYHEYCNYADHFNAHKMVFDLTFCGDWAGAAWPGSGCGSGNCTYFVDNNPTAFNESYWEINSLRVYTLTVVTMTLRWPSNVKPYFYFYFVFKPFRPILRCITVAFLFFF